MSSRTITRELILHACHLPSLRGRIRAQAHLIDLIVDQLEIVEPSPLHLASPIDPRAVRIAEVLSGDPSDQRSLEEICKTAGASNSAWSFIAMFKKALGTTPRQYFATQTNGGARTRQE
jgi:hypothetical protein